VSKRFIVFYKQGWFAKKDGLKGFMSTFLSESRLILRGYLAPFSTIPIRTGIPTLQAYNPTHP